MVEPGVGVSFAETNRKGMNFRIENGEDIWVSTDKLSERGRGRTDASSKQLAVTPTLKDRDFKK